jgi:hypothetical protein
MNMLEKPIENTKTFPQLIAFAFLVTNIVSCQTKYLRTEKTCMKNCFLEIYERSQLGISYLTDSINFRIYVGQLNFENEYYQYKCKDDNLTILKYSKGLGNSNDLIATKNYNLKQLKAENRQDR